MRNIRIQLEKKANRLIITGNRIQSFNDYELSSIKDSVIHGIMKMRKEKEDQPVRMSVDLNGYVSLKEYLKTVTMTKRLLVNVFEGIITVMVKAESKRFTGELFVYKTDYVFVDVSKTDIFMTYIPLHPCESNGRINDLLSEIVRDSVFDPSEDLSYVPELIGLIKKQDMTLYSLREYLDRLKTESDKNNSYGLEKQNSTVCEANHDKLSYGKRDVYPFVLLNVATGARTDINKDMFSIGREPDSSDLVIDRSAVSRAHAVIVREKDGYYIIDRFSRNGTFVNGERIEGGTKVSIAENDQIGFADCRFQFLRKEVV